MLLLWLLILVLILCFAGVFLGAPYLPTLKRQVDAALDLADLKKGQTLIELGCGDGKVLVAAAKRGIKSVGYELNPIMFVVAWLRTRRYRHMTKVIWGNFWMKSWPEADAIFVFLINRYMKKLDRRIENYPYLPIRLVSHAFKMPIKKVSAEKDGVYLYLYK